MPDRSSSFPLNQGSFRSVERIAGQDAFVFIPAESGVIAIHDKYLAGRSTVFIPAESGVISIADKRSSTSTILVFIPAESGVISTDERDSGHVLSGLHSR